MTLQRYEHRYGSMEPSEHGAWVLADKADEEIARLNRELDSLNEMLRQTGYGQGQIDAYDSLCVEIAELKAHYERLRELVQRAIEGDELNGESLGDFRRFSVHKKWIEMAKELLDD